MKDIQQDKENERIKIILNTIPKPILYRFFEEKIYREELKKYNTRLVSNVIFKGIDDQWKFHCNCDNCKFFRNNINYYD